MLTFPTSLPDDYRDHAADRIAEMVAAGWDQREACLALFGGGL